MKSAVWTIERRKRLGPLTRQYAMPDSRIDIEIESFEEFFRYNGISLTSKASYYKYLKGWLMAVEYQYLNRRIGK